MIALVCFVLASPFKSRSRLEAENAALRQQLIVLRREVRGRAQLTNSDRWFFVQLYRWFPSILQVFTVIHPETLVRWHRAGFRRYWRWKSRRRGGRPQITTDIFIMLYIGGRGSTIGPIVGAGVLILLPQWMSGLERYQNLVFFVVLLALILVAPNGLFGATFETRGSVIDWLRSRLRGGAGSRNV